MAAGVVAHARWQAGWQVDHAQDSAGICVARCVERVDRDRGAAFSSRCCQRSNHWGIVGAVDGEVQNLGRAIQGLDGEAVYLGRISRQRLHTAFCHAVCVAAAGLHREAAQVACGATDRGLQVALALVFIGDGERATGSQGGGRCGVGDIGGYRVADGGQIVGALHGEGQGCRCCHSPVRHTVADGQGRGLPQAE